MVQLVHAGQFDLVPKISNLGTGFSQGMQMANQFQAGKQKRLEDTQEQSFLRADLVYKMASEMEGMEPDQAEAYFNSMSDEIAGAGIDISSLGPLNFEKESIADVKRKVRPLLRNSDADLSAGQREWRDLTKHLSEEDKKKAARIKLKLDAGAVGSSLQTIAGNPELVALVAAYEKLLAEKKAGGKVVGQVEAEAETVDTATETETIKALSKDAAKHQSAAIDQLPTVRNSTKQIKGLVRKLKDHPGLAGAVGMPSFAGVTNAPGTPEADFNVLLDQIKGGTFLKGFQSLKGGGTITEVEGAKAENALARLGVRQSEAQFKASLDEYIYELGELEKIVEQKARGKSAQEAAPAAPKVGSGGDIDIDSLIQQAEQL